MNFKQLNLKGAYLITPQRYIDERGFFARVWCKDEFSKHGLEPVIEQCSISFNPRKGTLRGMHYQIPPHEETKLVRCTMGSIYDVIVDLRSDSKTYMNWIGIDLTSSNRNMLYIPKGFAHGFCTMEDNSEILYQMSDKYVPDSAKGFRWNDPAFGIKWPNLNFTLSERDANFTDYKK